MSVILYTIHCPACNVLEKKLKQANISYEVFDDETKMGQIEQFPMLQVDGGPLMTLKEANKWIKENSNG